LLEQKRNSSDLVRFLLGRQLSQHQAVCYGPCTHQMQCLLACCPIMRTPTRLPIYRDHSLDGGADPLHPVVKTCFKLFGINVGKDSSNGIMRRNSVGQLQQLGEPCFLCSHKFFDPYPSVCSTDHSTNRDNDDIAQSMVLGSFDTWVLYLSKYRFQVS